MEVAGQKFARSLCQYVIFQLMNGIELQKVKGRFKEGHRNIMEVQ